MTRRSAAPEASTEEALQRLQIESRCPVALRHAAEWLKVVQSLHRGLPETTACQLAGVNFDRWRKWMQWGTRGRSDRPGCEEHPDQNRGARCEACLRARAPRVPLQPYKDLVRARNIAKGAWRASVYTGMVDRAKAGDQRAGEYMLDREDSLARSETARKLKLAELELLRVNTELARTNLALAQKKLAGEHVEQHAILTPDDPRWRALQVQHLGGERQGVTDAPTGPDSPDDPVASE